ncbi:MAG: hypothetical protein XD43_0455, partial [Thermococcales archaeon 44_46]
MKKVLVGGLLIFALLFAVVASGCIGGQTQTPTGET